jgi:hypothetical protein
MVTEVCPKSAQKRERLLSYHLKFSKRLAAAEQYCFEPQAEVGKKSPRAVLAPSFRPCAIV